MTGIETERKFIIKKPSESVISEREGYTRSEILQIYLNDERMTHRVRRRIYTEGKTRAVEYTENTKIRIRCDSAIESEREISESEFYALAENIERGTRPINKIRETFVYNGKVFELDFYHEWEKTCIMEVELSDSLEIVEFPPFIEIIEEVTGRREYSNHAMARSFPLEIFG